MTTKLYAECKMCNDLVYREPGRLHGDGQQDTDTSPVWLLMTDIKSADYVASCREAAEAQGGTLPLCTCGCND